MSSFFFFAGEHPILTFLLAWMGLFFVCNLIVRAFRIVMVTLRGWPPAHLDADGDWRPAGDKSNKGA